MNTDDAFFEIPQEVGDEPDIKIENLESDASVYSVANADAIFELLSKYADIKRIAFSDTFNVRTLPQASFYAELKALVKGTSITDENLHSYVILFAKRQNYYVAGFFDAYMVLKSSCKPGSKIEVLQGVKEFPIVITAADAFYIQLLTRFFKPVNKMEGEGNNMVAKVVWKPKGMTNEVAKSLGVPSYRAKGKIYSMFTFLQDKLHGKTFSTSSALDAVSVLNIQRIPAIGCPRPQLEPYHKLVRKYPFFPQLITKGSWFAGYPVSNAAILAHWAGEAKHVAHFPPKCGPYLRVDYKYCFEFVPPHSHHPDVVVNANLEGKALWYVDNHLRIVSAMENEAMGIVGSMSVLADRSSELKLYTNKYAATKFNVFISFGTSPLVALVQDASGSFLGSKLLTILTYVPSMAVLCMNRNFMLTMTNKPNVIVVKIIEKEGTPMYEPIVTTDTISIQRFNPIALSAKSSLESYNSFKFHVNDGFESNLKSKEFDPVPKAFVGVKNNSKVPQRRSNSSMDCV